VGIQALKAVQRNEELLWRVSEILNAPLEKLDKTAEKLVKELKEVKAERRKLVEKLAKKAEPSLEVVREIGEVRLVTRDFKDEIDVDVMVQTANEIIRKDDSAVAVFYGSDGKTARIMVMAGKKAIEKGVNAAEIVQETSAIIGGGGGGRTNFAQGGGTKPERLKEALERVEEILRRQIGA
ncbi:MAG: DHHA1 domain-containing protein, partial [Candidatus Bathyarchaeia archaeon]